MYTLYLLLFIISIVVIFMTNNLYYLSLFILFQIYLIIKKKISIKSLIRIVKKNFFILITVLVVNMIFMNVIEGIILFIKLLIIIIATSINRYIITSERLTKCIEDIFFFSKDKENISLIVTMAVSLIPILNNIIHEIRYSLKSRNFNLGLININQSYIMFITFINQIFKKTNEIELSLISRGFDR